MKLQSTHKDVIIVGGGLAGLSAACYLAQAGVAVTLFEKAANLGGRAATKNYGGYHFNRGIHALYCGGATEQVLKELEIPYCGHKPKGVFVLQQGKLYTAPIDPLTLLRTSLLSAADKLELVRLFAAIPQIQAQSFQHMSVQEWLDRAIRRPRVRQFMEANARTFVYSAALDLVSADVFIVKTQLALKHPVLYIDGGWQTLIDGLHHKAEQAGTRIESGTRVESVIQQAGQVQGVHLSNGSTRYASAVIIATSPQEAAKLIDAPVSPSLHHTVASLIPAQVACLDVALERLPDPRYPVVQDLDRPQFYSTQSLFSRIAPEGGALIYSFKQLDPNHPGDPREDERDLENLLDTVQPGWRDLVVKRFFLPRIDAIGMLPTARSGGYAGRPGIQVADLANLYLIGDWIGEGFLSDPSMGSARQVAQHLLQTNKITAGTKAIS
jgi:phytoene dehydrogenase-like protein